MAQIERREGKKRVSYLITVNCGKDSEGNQIRHRKTYIPPQTWSETRQEREAQKEADKFEDQIKQGFALDNRQTFTEYAQYVLSIKRREGKKESTLERYADMLNRINPIIGHLKLADIRPQHLNNLYDELGKGGLRRSSTATMATLKIDLRAELKSRGLTQAEFAQQAGLSVRSNAPAKKGPISGATATKIADALGGKVEKYFDLERDMRPLSAKTILEHHRLISSVLGQAEKEMLVPYNAAAKATPPKPKRKEPNYFQPETIHAILDAVEEEPLKYKVFVNLAAVTGARRGELAGLKWENINLNTGQIVIDHALLYSTHRGVYEDSTKTGEHRYPKIPMELIEMLKDLKTEQIGLRLKAGDRWHDTGYVFVQDDGQPVHPDTWTQWLNTFSKRHGLPHINPHAFRHTAASILISNNVDEITVSRILGHSSPNTTRMYYSHMIEAAKSAAEDTIADILIRRQA